MGGFKNDIPESTVQLLEKKKKKNEETVNPK
jgi:hypothetical protein